MQIWSSLTAITMAQICLVCLLLSLSLLSLLHLIFFTIKQYSPEWVNFFATPVLSVFIKIIMIHVFILLFACRHVTIVCWIEAVGLFNRDRTTIELINRIRTHRSSFSWKLKSNIWKDEWITSWKLSLLSPSSKKVKWRLCWNTDGLDRSTHRATTSRT